MMRYNTGPNAESRISHRGTGPLVIHTNEAASIRFYTNNGEKIRIADTGELLVGTTSISSGLKVDVE